MRLLDGENEGDYWKQIHAILATIAWFGFENLILWTAFLKNFRYGIIFHIFFASLLSSLYFLGAIIIMIVKGFQQVNERFLHAMTGFVLLCLMPVLLISGALSKITQLSAFKSSKSTVVFNRIHKIFALIIIIWSKVTLYSSWKEQKIIFLGLLIPDIISHALYFGLKIFKKVKEVDSLDRGDQKDRNLRQITSQKMLRVYGDNYFIFADKVYNLSALLSTHPGGLQIINNISGREVDRFMYGVQPLEMMPDSTYAHELGAIRLAGNPLAELHNKNCYPEFHEKWVGAWIREMYAYDPNGQMYVMNLSSRYDKKKFKFTGYSELCQLGQFYAVTGEGTTRLFTSVNFLHPQNIALMKDLSRGETDCRVAFTKRSQENIMGSAANLNNDMQIANEPIIPLLMKRYSNGKFTSRVLTNTYYSQVQISKPRGMGLGLQNKAAGKIILMAGGTGINPFCDLIDLLHKESELEGISPKSKTIEDQNPILKSKPFAKFKFILYLSVNSLLQLHPITIFQLTQLSSKKVLTLHIKTKGEASQKIAEKMMAHLMQENFEDAIRLEESEGSGSPSQYYICGPTRFTKSIIEGMERQGVSKSLYSIV